MSWSKCCGCAMAFLCSMSVTYDGIVLLSFRLIPKKLMSSYTGMEECEKRNTTTKRKM